MAVELDELSNDLDRVCGVLTGMFLQMKKSRAEGQAFIAGMTAEGKFDVTTVVTLGRSESNRHQMGLLVNALRQKDQEAHYIAVGIALDVAFTDQANGRKTDALYVCLEDRQGNAKDVVFPYKKKLLGGFRLETPRTKVTEPRVYGPKGDELVALIQDKVRTVYPGK